MAKVPCLCGDPYCPSCGNPEAARCDDALQYFVERIKENLKDETELDIFYTAGMEAVQHYRRSGPEPPD